MQNFNVDLFSAKKKKRKEMNNVLGEFLKIFYDY